MKKLLSLLIAAGMLASVSCSSGGSSESSHPAAVTVSQTKYKEERVEKPAGFGSFEDMAYVEGHGTRLMWSSAGKFSFADCGEDMQFSEPVELFSADHIYMTRSCISPDGTMSLLVIYAENDVELTDPDYYKTANYSLEIRTYDSDGAELAVTELIDIHNYIEPYSDFITFFCPYGEQWIIGYNSGRLLIGADGTVADNNDRELHFEFYGIDSDGGYLFCNATEYGYMDGKTLKEPRTMTKYGDFLRISKGLFAGTGEYKVYFVMNDGIFGLTADGTLVEQLNFLGSRISVNEVYSAAYVGEGRFALYGADDTGSYLSLMTVRPDDYVENREKFIVGSLSLYSNHSEMSNKYNKKSENFEAEYKIYSGGIDDVKTDILGGDSPDVLEFFDRSDMIRLCNLGALADMNELSEQYGGFNESDILDNVVQAYKYKDGLYSMSQCFALPIVLGKKKYFPNSTMTFDEFYDIVAKMPEDMTFGGEWLTSPRDVFSFLVSNNLSSWVDFDKAECYFDSPEFVKALEFTKTVRLSPERDLEEFYKTSTEEEQMIYNQERMHEVANEKALVNTQWIHGLSSVSDLRNSYGLTDEDIIYLTPPSLDPKGLIWGTNNSYFSVLRSGKCTEGGWDYANYIMSDEFLSSYLQTQTNFPTRRETFEKQLIEGQKRSQNHIWIDEEGVTHNDYSFGDAITDLDLEKLRSYLSMCTACTDTDDTVSGILDEEFAAFEAGEVTAGRCAELIQNRVSIYLSENA